MNLASFVKTYFISYGPIQRQATTLKEARGIAREVSRETLYEINIVGNGNVIETFKPRISKSGRVTFRKQSKRAA